MRSLTFLALNKETCYVSLGQIEREEIKRCGLHRITQMKSGNVAQCA